MKTPLLNPKTHSSALPLDRETLRVVHRYRKHDRLYTWCFYFALLPVVFAVIYTDVGECNTDVLLSFGFFALLTCILAVGARRQTAQGWTGRVVGKIVRVSGRSGGLSKDGTPRLSLEIRKNSGRIIRIPVPGVLFDYFQEDDALVKIPGLPWPEKAVLDDDRRVCLFCGAVLSRMDSACPRCRGPVLDHPTLCRLAQSQSGD
jgi:hypothetical protein